jgi:WD40 repeat protein
MLLGGQPCHAAALVLLSKSLSATAVCDNRAQHSGRFALAEKYPNCPLTAIEDSPMKFSQDGLPRILVIASLVVAGFLYANDPDMCHWLWSCFHAADAARKPLSTISVYQIDWSVDGQKLLARSHTTAEGYRAARDIALYDAVHKTGCRPVSTMGDSISSAVLAPDGRFVLASSFEGRLWWISLESTESISHMELPRASSFTAAAVSDDGRLAAAADDRVSIRLFDLSDHWPTESSPSFVMSARQSRIGALHFSRDGRWLVAARHDGSISVWDVLTAKVLQEFVGHEKPAMAAEFLPGGNRIISVSLDDTVRIWDIDSGREDWRAEFDLRGISALTVSRTGTTAAWGGFNGKIVVWDLVRARKHYEIVTLMTTIFDLKLSPDGTCLAVAGTGGTIRFYNAQTGVEQQGIEVDGPQDYLEPLTR